MAQINLDTLPRSRKEAQALGSKHYFNGKPCPKGHVGARYASSGSCFDCGYIRGDADAKKLSAERRQSVLSMQIVCAHCETVFTPEFKGGMRAKYCCRACRVEGRKADSLRWARTNPERRKEIANAYAARVTEEKGEQWQAVRRRDDAARKRRLESDLEFRMVHRLRTRLCAALRHYSKNKTTSVTNLVGCSMEELRAHIESQFQPGMTWDNWTRDGWHLDHIRPIASFDRPDHPDCWHYTNLQPLWAEDNLKKGARLAA